MKKILTIFGLIIVTNSAFAINPDSPMGKSWLHRANFSCVKDLVYNDVWTIEFATKYCNCTMRKFVSEMSLKELEMYGEDDPVIEVKANELINKFSEECAEELAK